MQKKLCSRIKSLNVSGLIDAEGQGFKVSRFFSRDKLELQNVFTKKMVTSLRVKMAIMTRNLIQEMFWCLLWTREWSNANCCVLDACLSQALSQTHITSPCPRPPHGSGTISVASHSKRGPEQKEVS